MLQLNSRNDLQRLIDEQLQESLTLDYKSSISLGRASTQRDELCKDVSAFANSAGGQIVYGVVEQDHVPVSIDDGVAINDINREWIEQVLSSRIQPRIDGLIITPIPVGPSRSAFAISIPQATSRAPHQAPDKKYYKRHNFMSEPMEDYEVRDILRRASSPELFVNFALDGVEAVDVVVQEGNDRSNPIELQAAIRNRANEPAFYTYATLFVDERMRVIDTGELDRGTRYEFPENRAAIGYHKKMAVPGHFPIFREHGWRLAYFRFDLASDITIPETNLILGYDIKTPGFAGQKIGNLLLRNRRLYLLPPLWPPEV